MILIDASEPLWRTRSEPRLETVPNQNDPAFQRVVPQNVPALEILEQAGASIARFVRTRSGTRTLAIVATPSPPAAGATITLAARTVASALYGIAEQSRRTRCDQIHQCPVGGGRRMNIQIIEHPMMCSNAAASAHWVLVCWMLDVFQIA
jgi:hypothetical protein